jgi:hypothetical protein
MASLDAHSDQAIFALSRLFQYTCFGGIITIPEYFDISPFDSKTKSRNSR